MTDRPTSSQSPTKAMAGRHRRFAALRAPVMAVAPRVAAVSVATLLAAHALAAASVDAAPLVAAVALATEPNPAGGGSLRATSDEPRAYGYRVGDMVRRHVTVQAPRGVDFDPASLPPLGRHGTALELRDVRWELHRHMNGSQRIELAFVYQVFVAPKETRVYELPAIKLTFRGGPAGSSDVRFDAWPVSVAPLTPEDIVNRRGLGEFRPDAKAPLVSTVGLRWQLGLCAAALALLGLYLLHVYAGLPWSRARQRPFAAALRDMKRVDHAATHDGVRSAYRKLHAALNRTAGGVLFAGAVDRFVVAHPAFAPLRTELTDFFARSEAEFFAVTEATKPPADAMRWLTRFAKRCRDAESGRT